MTVVHIQESELIIRSKSGDRSSFERLFNLHKESIKSFLVTLSNNEFDSNDLLQETFIKAFLRIASYKECVSFELWLRIIAKNTFLDSVRRKSVKNSLISFDADCYREESVEACEDEFCEEELFGQMESQILNLPDNYRSVLEYKYYHGMNYDEISQKLNVPLGTIKTWLFRAKEMLRIKIQEE